jgi:hypothetical protein
MELDLDALQELPSEELRATGCAATCSGSCTGTCPATCPLTGVW